MLSLTIILTCCFVQFTSNEFIFPLFEVNNESNGRKQRVTHNFLWRHLTGFCTIVKSRNGGEISKYLFLESHIFSYTFPNQICLVDSCLMHLKHIGLDNPNHNLYIMLIIVTFCISRICSVKKGKLKIVVIRVMRYL